MAERRPLIGITSHGRVSDPRRYGLGVTYVSAVRRAGGHAVILPPDAEAAGLAERLEGLVLSGGGDIEASRYGETQHEEAYGVDPERDAFELALAREALARAVPVLAICRGLQIVNVALGGDLVQHLPDAGSERTAHRAGSGRSTSHAVRVAPDSRLAAVLDATAFEVSSMHHQAPRRLGRGLRPVAWADDETVEALELDGHADLVAVQWHPEETAHEDERQQRLFRWLVERAAPAAARRRS
ncbi:MAG: gamma-glutamyl-gamma-aminobutyrate hydrolase family protein [Gemmatimonadales bacterium]